MKLWQKNILILAAVAVIAAVPLVFVKNSEFGGSDMAAEEAILEINPEYETWFAPVFELPGGEMETLLFTVQAAVGAGVLGFVLGRLTAKRKPDTSRQAECGEHCATN